MPDAFVYYFLIRDRSSGKLVSSKRRATLDAIKSKGEPLLESQMAVDDSEVDARVSWSLDALTARILRTKCGAKSGH